MISFSLAFIVSFITTGLIVRLSRSRALAWDDHDVSGLQKFHARAVPRVVGLGVAMGMLLPIFEMSASFR